MTEPDPSFKEFFDFNNQLDKNIMISQESDVRSTKKSLRSVPKIDSKKPDSKTYSSSQIPHNVTIIHDERAVKMTQNLFNFSSIQGRKTKFKRFKLNSRQKSGLPQKP